MRGFGNARILSAKRLLELKSYREGVGDLISELQVLAAFLIIDDGIEFPKVDPAPLVQDGFVRDSALHLARHLRVAADCDGVDDLAFQR